MNTQVDTHRYVIRHNRTVLYFLRFEDEGEYQVTLNANGTTGCQHNGSQECASACAHIEAAKILEMHEQETQQKYYAAQQAAAARRESAPLNGNRGFSLLR